MSDLTANFAKTIVDGYYSSSDVAITVLDPGRFPAVPFTAVWWNATDYADPSDDPDRELVRVTSIVSDVFNITRAQESTSASAKDTANKVYKMQAGITAAMWNGLTGSTGGNVARIISVSGSPEGVTTASPYTLAFDTVGNDLYVKKTGSGNTGWVLV